MIHRSDAHRLVVTRIPVGILVVATVVVLATVVGCSSDADDDADESDVVEQAESTETDDPGQDQESDEEIFGLPVPSDYRRIQDGERRVKVTVQKSFDDIEAFFRDRVVDYEIVRLDDALRLEPLRPHSPRVTISRYAGDRSPLLIDYRRDRSPAERVQRHLPGTEDGDDAPEQDEGVASSADDGPQPYGPNHAEWLDEVRGEPVELETSDGEKIAPGARWGEPYTPPEGSPLDSPEFRHNHGRRFGDWQPM